LALSSVGGDYFNKVLSLMAENAIIYSVSSINRESIEVKIRDIVFKQVAIKGFWISKWYQKNNYLFEERLNMLREIQQLYYGKEIDTPKHNFIYINDDLGSAFGQNEGIEQVFLF
jgi:NADPH:quinone reductase-like Zn-dependent oxidoreductase